MPHRYRMVRISAVLHARLQRVAKEILHAKERGWGYVNVPLAEQGQRGAWVPLPAVIALALDEFEDHRARSRRKRRISRRRGQANATHSVPPASRNAACDGV